jgi:hypothetical protein
VSLLFVSVVTAATVFGVITVTNTILVLKYHSGGCTMLFFEKGVTFETHTVYI